MFKFYSQDAVNREDHNDDLIKVTVKEFMDYQKKLTLNNNH